MEVIDVYVAAFQPDYVVLGGGNAREVGELPPNCRLGHNEDAFLGGFRLWVEDRPSGSIEPTRRKHVRLALQCTLTALAAAAVLSGCGGSDGPETVNGCVIEPSTSCASVDLSGADLEGADLSRATLSSTNLEGTNLSGANLTEANLSSARIIDADLSDADLTGANLANATISGTNLDGATLCGTIRTDGTVDDTSCPESTDTTTTWVVGRRGHLLRRR